VPAVPLDETASDFPRTVVERVGGGIQPVIVVFEIEREGFGQIVAGDGAQVPQIAPAEQIFKAELIMIGGRDLVEGETMSFPAMRSGSNFILAGQSERPLEGREFLRKV
jgi:hypothetical protein